VLYLVDGVVVAHGTHDELMETSEHYRELMQAFEHDRDLLGVDLLRDDDGAAIPGGGT
jgi:hypothetical protein